MEPLELTTRRQILAALLGVPFASTAACRRTPTFDFDGDFVGDAMPLGHAWRDERLAEAPALADKAVDILILGAGPAGLTAGWRLRQAGVSNLALVDIGAEPGGTSVAGGSSVTAYPWGAHYLPAPTADNADLLELLDEMGLIVGRRKDGSPVYDEAVLCGAPRERVFYKGRWYPGLLPDAMTADDTEWARFQQAVATWVGFRDADGRRAFTIPVAACSDDPRVRALDGRSMADWLTEHRFESPWVRAAVDYACRDDFGAGPDDVSAWYGLHYFAARTPSPGDASAPFLTWPEGNARLVRHLIGRVGAGRFFGRTVVTAVRPSAAGWRVETFDGSAGRPRAWSARQVIFALPSFMRRRLIENSTAATYAPTYGSWLVANLHLDGRPGYAGFETAWDNVVHGSRSLGYVVATHQTGSVYGPTVWTWYLPLAEPDAKGARRALQSLTWRDAADAVVTDLAGAHDELHRYLRRIDVRRWGHAMVRPEPGLAFGAARAAATRSVDGLHFAHADLSGVALFEEAFYQGDRAAKAALAYRSKT